jgi:HEPN domain-containing protein
MTAQEKFEYWLELAQGDLNAADVMFKNSLWLYTVFMCQQSIEKLVKGLYILYIDDIVPRLHNISKLIKKFESSLSKPIPTQNYDLFDKLSDFYLDSRYPDYKNKLNKLLTKRVTEIYLHQTKEAFAWLLTLKP